MLFGLRGPRLYKCVPLSLCVEQACPSNGAIVLRKTRARPGSQTTEHAEQLLAMQATRFRGVLFHSEHRPLSMQFYKLYIQLTANGPGP